MDSNGTVTATGAGSAEITVKTPTGRYTHCTVKVNAVPESIEAPATMEVARGGSKKIVISTERAEAQGCTLVWISSDSSICSVSKDGVLKGNKYGSAVVSCRTENGLTADIKVEVYRGITEIKAGYKEITVGVNCEKQLAFSVKPSDAKYQKLTYTSSNESIAAVDENGLVRGIAEGTCRVTASDTEGHSASVNVIVKYVKLKSVKLGTNFTTLKAGEKKVPEIVYEPEDASDRNVTLASSNRDIVAVEGNTLVATGAGRCVITVYANGAACDEMTVRVINDDSRPLEGIHIGINPGHQISLNLTKKPLAPGSSRTGNANSGYAVGRVTGVKEYEVTLGVGLYLRDMLEALGAEVTMTRTENDVHIDNIERAQMLNNAGVDFAIQLHCNNNPESKTVSGMSMFVKSKDPVSYEIADTILKATCDHTGARNLNTSKYDRYMSLNWSTTPAALIEMGYLSTPADDRLLSTSEYQYLIAQGICNGICEYYNK